jgi:hypothetical protein
VRPRGPKSPVPPLAALVLLCLAACGGDARGVGRTGEADDYAFAVSQIVVRVSPEGRNEGEAFVRARQAHERILAGASFEEIARARSDDATAQDGGFLGFVEVHFDTAFAGAVQALEPGEVSPVVHTPVGYHVIYRHPYEEGRRLERALQIPAHGFWVPHGEMPGADGRTMEEARSTAREMLGALRRGEMTMSEAREAARGVPPGREDGYLGGFRDRPPYEQIHAALSGVAEGEFLAEPVDTEGGFAVLRRGRHLRCLARHILVRHSASEGLQRGIMRQPAEAEARAKEALAQARARPEAWGELVQRYSDDLRTVGNQGTLGVVGPGKLPDSVEEALLGMAPGEIHPSVVASPLGFHVLLRVD